MRARLLTVPTAVLGLLLTVAPAAEAATVVLTDPVGDSYSGIDWEEERNDDIGDVARVTVAHTSTRAIVTVRLSRRSSHPDQYNVFLDTSSTRTGPEYVASIYWGEDGRRYVGIHRAGGNDFSCSGFRIFSLARTTTLGLGQKFSVPRTCLRSPRIVRAKVSTFQEHGADDVTAWSRWARRG